jgi:hypothetical protein
MTEDQRELLEEGVLSARVREKPYAGALECGPNFRGGRMAHGRNGSDAAAHQALA